MAKVDILSMQRIINYGSFLQAYALKRLISDLGHDVGFADYRVGAPVVRTHRRQLPGILRKFGKAAEVFGYHASLKQKIRYIGFKKNFAKKYHHLLGMETVPNYTPETDVLVIGSDEVFNCIQENPNVGYSPELFGADNHARKVISYAASFGNTTETKLERYGKRSEIAGLLNRFDALSVRDEHSAEMVRALTGKEPSCHVDPVLAYDWDREFPVSCKSDRKEKYLILYAYSGRISKSEGKIIRDYARAKGYKVYAIGGVHPYVDRFIDCSPFEVRAWFRNAEEVITDTFHGTIFSIITKRKFTTLVRKSVGNSYGNEEKLTDLLQRFGLKNRMTYDLRNPASIRNGNVDYDAVDRILEKERKRTTDYLKHLINDCPDERRKYESVLTDGGGVE